MTESDWGGHGNTRNPVIEKNTNTWNEEQASLFMKYGNMYCQNLMVLIIFCNGVSIYTSYSIISLTFRDHTWPCKYHDNGYKHSANEDYELCVFWVCMCVMFSFSFSNDMDFVFWKWWHLQFYIQTRVIAQLALGYFPRDLCQLSGAWHTSWSTPSPCPRTSPCRSGRDVQPGGTEGRQGSARSATTKLKAKVCRGPEPETISPPTRLYRLTRSCRCLGGIFWWWNEHVVVPAGSLSGIWWQLWTLRHCTDCLQVHAVSPPKETSSFGPQGQRIYLQADLFLSVSVLLSGVLGQTYSQV